MKKLKATKPARGIFDFNLDCGKSLRLDFIAPGIIRIRVSPDGTFPEAVLNKYNFVRERKIPHKVRVREKGKTAELTAGDITAIIDKKRLCLKFIDRAGKTLLKEIDRSKVDVSGGFLLQLGLYPEERFFGLGDQNRQNIEHRGRKAEMWIKNVKSYIPIPFLMSTRGYGIFVNTTCHHIFDIGSTLSGKMTISSNRARLDYYFIHGPGLDNILERYTGLTGRPALPPKWSLGLWFICRMQADAKELTDDCLNFRREGIPCDVIGLEPGWMEKWYDYTTKKNWHPEKFPIPSYAICGRHNFLPAIKRMGFKPELWLCNDYDLSFEAERRHGKLETAKALSEKSSAEFYKEDKEMDKNFLYPIMMDKITDPDEPWFEHLKKFIDQGVDFFKQDGALQTLEHPDRKWGNGMSDAEMHNLYPLLYSQQMHEGFRKYTGRRACCFTPNGWAGLQRYTGTWAGDTGGEHKTLAACLNLGLCGHSWTTCDMEVTTAEGIHYGFLMPWSQVNSWNYWRHPWLLGDKLAPIFKEYAKLRYQLLPYIYSCAYESYKTGLPMMRAMVLEFPDDKNTYNLTRQYMLGRELLVGAFTRRIYLPEGLWTDYWTGKSYKGPKTIQYKPPQNRGGALFIRAGAIIPMLAKVPDYIGQFPEDLLILDIYPGTASKFDLYEDDGITYEYAKGAFSFTGFEICPDKGGWKIDISKRQGKYKGMPDNRRYCLKIHLLQKPASVSFKNKTLQQVEPDGLLEDKVNKFSWDSKQKLLFIYANKNIAGSFYIR